MHRRGWWFRRRWYQIGLESVLFFAEFLDVCSVTERIERVLDAIASWRDACENCETRTAAPRMTHERVSEKVRESTATEWHMCVICDTGTALIRRRGASLAIERANALLESEQAFVDFCSFLPRASIGAVGVRATFTPREIDEAELASHAILDRSTRVYLQLENVV